MSAADSARADIRSAAALAEAVNEAHRLVPMLRSFVQACRAYCADRSLL